MVFATISSLNIARHPNRGTMTINNLSGDTTNVYSLYWQNEVLFVGISAYLNKERTDLHSTYGN